MRTIWKMDGVHTWRRAVRDKFGKPTIAIGNIRDPKIADDILARGDADLIGMGRGLIADPDWCNKAQYGGCM